MVTFFWNCSACIYQEVKHFKAKFGRKVFKDGIADENGSVSSNKEKLLKRK